VLAFAAIAFVLVLNLALWVALGILIIMLGVLLLVAVFMMLLDNL
jgi:hypothetical protein